MKSHLAGAALVAILSTSGFLAACATEEHVAEREAAIRTDMASADAATNDRVAAVDMAAKDAMARANEAHASAQHPFVYSVLMQDDSVKFDTNKSELSPEAQTILTNFAEKLKAENKNVFIEIQGHADGRGSASANMALGEKRADAVKRFLSQQGVPLARMNAISYGEEKLKPGETEQQAQAESRRVVLIVMNGGPG